MKQALRALFVALSVVAALAAPASAQEAVKVGVIQPLSGSVAASGNYVRMGAEIGRDWINAKGGVLGRKVELLIEDNKSDPKEAATAAEKLIALLCQLLQRRLIELGRNRRHLRRRYRNPPFGACRDGAVGAPQFDTHLHQRCRPFRHCDLELADGVGRQQP